jgi:hypothetical protein
MEALIWTFRRMVWTMFVVMVVMMWLVVEGSTICLCVGGGPDQKTA